MKHAFEYIETMEKLEELIRKVPKYSNWTFTTLCDWFSYFWNRGTLVFSIDQEGVAHGVCVVKLFSKLEQFLEPFVHEPHGAFCMIELMSADGAQTLGYLHDELVDRWGPRELMIWDRGERTERGAPRMYRWKEFEKLARRITHERQVSQ